MHADADVEAARELEKEGQFWQLVAVSRYLPGAHALHVSPPAPDDDMCPALQKQAVMLMLLLGELVPAGHDEHETSPGTALNLPELQALHVAPLGPLKPCLHTQSDAASLALGDRELEGHGEHDPAPTSVLNVPAAHAAHELPWYPALQAHWEDEVLPAGDTVLLGQSLHVHGDVLDRYWLAGQALQVQASTEVLPAGELELLGQSLHSHGDVLDRYLLAGQSEHDATATTEYVQSADTVTVLPLL